MFWILVSCSSFSQDSVKTKKTQEGFVFISEYNFLYNQPSGHMRPVDFHDYFFPTNDSNIEQLLDSNKTFSFKDGRRIQFFPQRFYYKKIAKQLIIEPTDCYIERKLYVVPVVLEFEEYKDNWPRICKTNSYHLKVVGGGSLSFELSPKAVDVRSTKEQVKRKVNKLPTTSASKNKG